MNWDPAPSLDELIPTGVPGRWFRSCAPDGVYDAYCFQTETGHCFWFTNPNSESHTWVEHSQPPTDLRATADPNPPSFAKPLAPLPDWLKEVDQLLEDSTPDE